MSKMALKKDAIISIIDNDKSDREDSFHNNDGLDLYCAFQSNNIHALVFLGALQY